MELSEVSARLRFLDGAAHLLATTSPEVSRHLMSSHHSLVSEQNLEVTQLQKRNACGACGTIMILGWEGRLEMESAKAKAKGIKKKPPEGTSQPRVMVYTCDSCSNTTRLAIDTSSKQPRYKRVSKHTTTTRPTKETATPVRVDDVTRSAATASKKRSKSKKQSGLGALLAKQKASQSIGTGFGLDLMDFMKQS